MFKNLIISTAHISLIAMLMFSSGCGRTLARWSYNDDPRFCPDPDPPLTHIYMGIRFSLKRLFSDKKVSKRNKINSLVAHTVVILDLPFSFALDTVMLSFDIIYEFEISDNRKKVEAALLKNIEAKGYSTASNIVNEMWKKYGSNTVTDRRVKKYIPDLLKKHNLTEVVVNKELKVKYLLRRGLLIRHPKIIVRKED